MGRLPAVLLFPLLCLPAGGEADYVRAKQKIELIENERAVAHSTVRFSAGEINAYARAEVVQQVPEGLRNPAVVLGDGWATGSALIDFLKLQQGRGEAPGWLLSKLLAGERPVSVTVRMQSGGGRATVDVERVEIAGVRLDGAALDFLIENFLLPRYPEAKIGTPFELGHRMERIEVRASGVGVAIGR